MDRNFLEVILRFTCAARITTRVPTIDERLARKTRNNGHS